MSTKHPILLFPTLMEAKPAMETFAQADIRVCGVGPSQVAAFTAGVCVENPPLVILCGIAGSYSTHMVGEVVQVSVEKEMILPSRFRKSFSPSYIIEGVPSATSATVSGPVDEPAQADIENMEGASFFAVCNAMGVKCAQLRAISNNVGEKFENWDTDKALNNLIKVLKNIL